MAQPSSLARAVCELNVLLDLENRATRRLSRRRAGDRHGFLILARIFHTQSRKLSQVEVADLLRLTVSQVQKSSDELASQGFIAREHGAPRGGHYLKLTAKGLTAFEAKLAAGTKEFALFEVVWETDPEKRQALGLLQTALKAIGQEVVDRAGS